MAKTEPTALAAGITNLPTHCAQLELCPLAPIFGGLITGSSDVVVDFFR